MTTAHGPVYAVRLTDASWLSLTGISELFDIQ